MRLKQFLSVLSFSAVLGFGQAPAAKPPAAPAAPAAPAEARPDGLYTTIQTSMGSIIAQLYEKESPITVKNFVDLALGRKRWTNPKTGVRAAKPLYAGTIFHRVIPGFMIQGGDPEGTGMGGVDTIKDEFAPGLTYDQPGRLGMANAGLGTGSCQFFITEVPTPHLDGKHTIFGQVVEGQELVGKIARVPTGENNRPRTPVVIQKVTFERWADGKKVPLQPTATKAAPKKATSSKAASSKTAAPKK